MSNPETENGRVKMQAAMPPGRADKPDALGEVSLRSARGAKAAWRDLSEGARQWPLWWMMAWQQVGSQYRRTVLGPGG